MWGLFNLLGAPGNTGGDGSIGGITGQIETYSRIVTLIFLSFCGLLVTLYAIWIGWKFAKAQDDGARKNAKSQLIYALIGVMSITVVIILTQFVVNGLRGTGPGIEDGGIGGVTETYNAIADIINSILNVLVTAAVVYGVYVGWQFMKADDDAKRKNAKTQLLYTIIGVVAVVLINVVISAVFSSLGGMI